MAARGDVWLVDLSDRLGRFARKSSIAAEAVRDLAYGARLLRRSPAAVAVTILGLGVAIGVGTAVFTLLNAHALRPSGIREPSSVVRVLRGIQNGLSTSWPYAEFAAVRDASIDVPLAASVGEAASFSTAANTSSNDKALLQFTSGNYLALLGARAALGRVLVVSDDVIGAPPAAVLSHAFWSRRLGADPAMVGRVVWLNGAAFTVVGVAERGFTGTYDTPPAIWLPMAGYHLALGGPPVSPASQVRVHVVGRIPSGVTAAHAQALVAARAAAVGQSLGAQGGERLAGARFEPADSRVKRGEAAFIALVVTIVITVIGLIVLLACANVANLLLASAISRRREIGVRLALGASRGRIVRQLLTESLSLGLVAGTIGLLLTLSLVPVLSIVTGAPMSVDLTPDWRVYAFLAVISVMAGLGAGLVPARHASRGDLVSPLKGAGGGSGGALAPTRVRSVLIGVQAGASVLLLVLAALLTRATLRAAEVDVGFDAKHLLTISPEFGRDRYETDDAARAYWDRALELTRALPGVQAVALASDVPFGEIHGVTIQENAGRRYTIDRNTTSADYFGTLGLRGLRGRTYTVDEVRDRAAVAVISDTLARDFFGGEDPIGQPLQRIVDDSNAVIIGVVANAITTRLRQLGSAAIYQPTGSMRALRMMIRSSGPPEALIQSVRSALQPIDPGMALEIQPVTDGLQRQLGESRSLASLAAVLAGIAVALAIVGIYGVTAFVVGQRRQEIGVRIALGASGEDVVRLLVGDSFKPVAIGLGGGMLAALLAGRVFAGVLYGVSSADPMAFGGAAIVLSLTALGAVIVPTRRTAAMEPAAVLREL